MNRPEEALQRTVAQYLDLALPKDAVWFHVPNGGARSKAEAGAFKAMGVKAGVPDVYILHKGKSFFIELKPPKCYLSGPQREMHKRILVAWSHVTICHDLDEVVACCVQWGIIKAVEGPTVRVRAGG